MKVKQLREVLNELDEKYDDHIIVMQKDAEGNGYSPLVQVGKDFLYLPETKWSGEAYPPDWSVEDMGTSEEEWENTKKECFPCLLLVPVN